MHHVAIVVKDTAEALEFYEGVLGLEVLPRPDFGVGGAWLRSGEQEIHLVERPGAEPSTIAHMAFRVTDVDAVVRTLTERGVQVQGPTELPNGARQAFTADPSGNLVEFNQPA